MRERKGKRKKCVLQKSLKIDQKYQQKRNVISIHLKKCLEHATTHKYGKAAQENSKSSDCGYW